MSLLLVKDNLLNFAELENIKGFQNEPLYQWNVTFQNWQKHFHSKMNMF